jgi:quercetin dioxygenase-like cupin family protein
MKKEFNVEFPDIIRKPEFEVESPWEGLRGYMFEGRDGSQVIFWECDIEIEVPSHKHDFDEYCLVVEGTCKETVEGKTTILNKGDECVIPAGKLHWATMGPNYRAIDYFGAPRCKYKNKP